MKISKLIALLEALKAEHGDLDSYRYDWEVDTYHELDTVYASPLWAVEGGYRSGALSDDSGIGPLAVPMALLLV